MNPIAIHPAVREALRDGRPVVALESAFLTHGLPRAPDPAAVPPGVDGWAPDGPVHLETALAMTRAVRAGGAAAAMVAVIGGVLRIGLDDEDVARLAADHAAAKAAAGTLAGALTGGRNAGTTVSATLVACSLAPSGPIRVLATGGIGGVHPGWTRRPDVSADLALLARTPTCVVCSGVKSILDVPSTLEALETLGVPVAGLGTEVLPRFHAAGSDDLRVPVRVEGPAEAAALCRAHWETLGQRSGVVLAVPVPAESALAHADLDAALREADRAAEARGVAGPERTPFLLAELARATAGRSLVANIALLVNNACIGAAVAASIASGGGAA